jgi:hypothetical protein
VRLFSTKRWMISTTNSKTKTNQKERYNTEGEGGKEYIRGSVEGGQRG